VAVACTTTDDVAVLEHHARRAQECPPPQSSCPVHDGANKLAVLNGIQGHVPAHNFLLVPTERIKGIECPAIVRPTATNYWQYASEERLDNRNRLV
jgi:CDP-diacylglycerol pyrophosphatase